MAAEHRASLERRVREEANRTRAALETLYEHWHVELGTPERTLSELINDVSRDIEKADHGLDEELKSLVVRHTVLRDNLHVALAKGRRA